MPLAARSARFKRSSTSWRMSTWPSSWRAPTPTTGAWALSTEAAELPVAASLARVAASEAGWQAAKENIQTHGGIGYTWEGDCHLNYRRAGLLRLALGGPGEWKRRLTRELTSRNIAPSHAA